MPDTAEWSARFYREKAWEIRRSAGDVRSAAVRLELFEITDAFDRMAGRAEKRPRSAHTWSKQAGGPSPPCHI